MPDDHEPRLAALEHAVADLQQTLARQDTAAPDPAGDGVFWALEELERRAPDAVLMTGSVTVPDAGPARWQYARHTEDLLATDWSELAATLDALGHPARLAILQLVLSGVRTTAELLEQESVGTTGQLHHHVRQLVAAGWLASTRRGRYEVPVARVVPLLVVVMAALR